MKRIKSGYPKISRALDLTYRMKLKTHFSSLMLHVT